MAWILKIIFKKKENCDFGYVYRRYDKSLTKYHQQPDLRFKIQITLFRVHIEIIYTKIHSIKTQQHIRRRVTSVYLRGLLYI